MLGEKNNTHFILSRLFIEVDSPFILKLLISFLQKKKKIEISPSRKKIIIEFNGRKKVYKRKIFYWEYTLIKKQESIVIGFFFRLNSIFHFFFVVVIRCDKIYWRVLRIIPSLTQLLWYFYSFMDTYIRETKFPTHREVKLFMPECMERGFDERWVLTGRLTLAIKAHMWHLLLFFLVFGYFCIFFDFFNVHMTAYLFIFDSFWNLFL